MTRHTLALILLGGCLALATTAQDKKDPPAKGSKTEDAKKAEAKAAFDVKKLLGTWVYVSAEKEGEKKSADDLKTESVEVTEKEFLLKGAGEFTMSYKIDASASPAKVAFEIVSETFKGTKALGILSLDGDDLKICYGDEKTAPAKFETPKDSGFRLLVLKRKK